MISLYNKLGAKAVQIINDRIEAGKDLDGKSFFYAKQTKELRKAKGRSTTGDFLQFTGAMLAALSYKATAKEAVIGFIQNLESEKAFKLSFAGVGRGRKKWKFFGLNDKEQEQLRDIAEKELSG